MNLRLRERITALERKLARQKAKGESFMSPKRAEKIRDLEQRVAILERQVQAKPDPEDAPPASTPPPNADRTQAERKPKAKPKAKAK